MYCKKCGNSINEGDEFCMECGNKIELNNSVNQENNLLLDKKSNFFGKIFQKKATKISAIIISAILVVLALFFIQYFSNPDYNLIKESKNYVKSLKTIEKVSIINDVVCIKKKKADSGAITYGYLIKYNGNLYAYFQDGKYMGDGESGSGDKGKSFSAIDNLEASLATIYYLAYIGNKHNELEELNVEIVKLNVN